MPGDGLRLYPRGTRDATQKHPPAATIDTALITIASGPGSPNLSNAFSH